MGAKVRTHPVSNEMLATLVSELLQEQRETNRLQREANDILKRKDSKWITPEEAAEMLGKIPTPSGSHTKALKYCRSKGWLRTFGQHRPYTYFRPEVEELARLIAQGKRVIVI